MEHVERLKVTILFFFKTRLQSLPFSFFHSLLEFNHEGNDPLTPAVREFGN